MGKNGVLSLDDNSLTVPMSIKKQYLMFDKLYVEETTLAVANGSIDRAILKQLHPAIQKTVLAARLSNSLFQHNLMNINYLQEQGFIEARDIKAEILKVAETDIFNEVKSLITSYKLPSEGTNPYGNTQYCDRMTRVLSLILKNHYEEDVYPLLLVPPPKADSSKKNMVLNFALSEIPEPDESISWEQLSDFKSDPDTMKKYYGLTKWINDVSRTEKPFHEIEEEYKYLYYEYLRQYEIHKLKHSMGFVEILVGAALDIISHNFSVTSFKSGLFSVWKKEVDLLEAETKFLGREIAYIYKAKQQFT
jgi:hypothetical protein